MPSWKRFVRYISSEDNEVHWGEPIVADGDDIDQLAQDGKLQANELAGESVFDAQPIGKKHLVKSLLVSELGFALLEHPMLFMKSRMAVHDTRQPVPVPKIGQTQCDYEGELVIVIGKDCKDVNPQEALDYVAGYCCGNDVSCRDWQMDGDKAGLPQQWSFSKSFDKCAPLGPCIVSPSILGNASKLEIKTFVNGEKRQHSNTSDFVFDVCSLVSFFSTGHTLERGSIIMTGTPNGVGLGMTPPRFLQHDDEVTVEIEGIGRLVNTMHFE